VQLRVVVGARVPTEELLEHANEALATLEVVPRRIEIGGLSVEVPDGWTGFSYDLDPGENRAPTLVVANVTWPEDGARNLAHVADTEQFGRLPPDGIVMQATAGRHAIGDPNQDPGAPLRLSNGHFIADQYEGQPAPHLSTQIISRRFGDGWVSVRV
jgi:hypothetical protein